MGVDLGRFSDELAEVAEELRVVALFWRTPDLGRVAYCGVARRDQGRCIAALHAAIGRIGVAVLEAEVGEAALPQRHAHVGRVGNALAVRSAIWDVAALEGARPDFHASAAGGVLEGEVEHACDGVGAVLGGGSVTQDLDLLQGDRRNHGDIRPLRAIGYPAADPRDDRPSVSALAIDQHQGVIRC